MKTLKIEIPKGYQVDEEKSTFTNIVFKPIEKKWVGLGLPSGTLWCNTNEEGYYSWNEMMNKFNEKNLPKLIDFVELCEYCSWKWDDKKKSIQVIGINGNYIFLPALGYRLADNNNLSNVDYYGFYWSTSLLSDNVYCLYFNFNNYVCPTYNFFREYGHSVRCIKRTK